MKSDNNFQHPLNKDIKSLWEQGSNKEFLELKSSRSWQGNHEIIADAEIENRLSWIEPKGISDKINKAFESYLSQVSMMYFGMNSNESLLNLNELPQMASNNQNEAQIEKTNDMHNLKNKQAGKQAKQEVLFI